MPDVSRNGVDEMRVSERQESMAWDDEQKDDVFDNRRVLEDYGQDDAQCCVRHNKYYVAIS